MKKIKNCFVIATIFFILTSCFDEKYDFGSIDKTIQIGGDSLAFPLGKTDTIKVKSLLDSMEVDLIKSLDDGTYVFSIVDYLDFSEKLPDFSESIILKEIMNYSVTKPLIRPTSPAVKSNVNYRTGSIASSSIKLTGAEHLIEINMEIKGVKEILSLDSILIENAFLSFDFILGGADNLSGIDAEMTVTVELPKKFIFKNPKIDENNVYRDTINFSDVKGYEVTPERLELLGFDFKGIDLFGTDQIDKIFEDEIKVNYNVEIKGVDLSDVTDIDALGLNLTLNAKISDFSLLYAKGMVDLGVEKLKQKMILKDVPEFMRSNDCVLDFSNPHLSFLLNANTGLPVDGRLNLVPYLNGKPIDGAIQEISFILPKSSNPETVKTGKYWFAKDDKLMPEGYELVVSKNISEVFKRIPDSIVVFIEVELDKNQTHILDFKAKYIGNIQYKLEVPFSFGDELHIRLNDTIPDIPSILSDILNEGGLELFAVIENSLPLQLELLLSGLDENGDLIQFTSTTNNIIRAASSTGASVKSDLKIALKRENASLKPNIESLIMTFQTTSPYSSGLPISDEDFLIADLRVGVPDGITIDLNDN